MWTYRPSSGVGDPSFFNCYTGGTSRVHWGNLARHALYGHSRAMTVNEALTVLGLDPSATEEEVRTAYRRAAHWCHPDKNPGNKVAEETFKRVSEAHGVLRAANGKRTSGGTTRSRRADDGTRDAGKSEARAAAERASREAAARAAAAREASAREASAREAAVRAAAQRAAAEQAAVREEAARSSARSWRTGLVWTIAIAATLLVGSTSKRKAVELESTRPAGLSPRPPTRADSKPPESARPYTPSTPSTVIPLRTTVVVQKGDSLRKIADRAGVEVTDLARWNHIRPPHLPHVGQELIIHKYPDDLQRASPGDAKAHPPDDRSDVVYSFVDDDGIVHVPRVPPSVRNAGGGPSPVPPREQTSPPAPPATPDE
jgi:curved DNA-binding protein CbpA